MPQIKKIFNNNVALVNDDKGLERILIGKGIAFGKRKGSVVQQKDVERVFVVDSPSVTNRFIQLVNEIPINHLDLVTRIIKDAEKDLGQSFSELTYIGLADHINYAINRYKKDHKIVNALLFEIKKFYPKEFAAGLKALKTISYYEGVELLEDEAAFIALHFVNGGQGNDIMHTILSSEALQKIELLVEDNLSIELDEESLNYMRFITHLKFFLQRITKNNTREESKPEIYNQIVDLYPLATQCVEVIVDYLQEKLSCEIYPEEKMYLILHVQRLIK